MSPHFVYPVTCGCTPDWLPPAAGCPVAVDGQWSLLISEKQNVVIHF